MSISVHSRAIRVGLLATAAMSTLAVASCNSDTSSPASNGVFEAWVAEMNQSGIITVSHGQITGSGSDVEVTDLEMVLSLEQAAGVISSLVGAEFDGLGDEADVTYTFSYPTLTFENLRDEGERYAADSMSAETAKLVSEVSVEANNQTGLQNGTTAYSGIVIKNLDWAKLPSLENDAENPVSQFFPVLRAALDFSFDEMVIDSTSTRSEDSNGFVMTMEQGAMTAGRTERGDFSEITGDSATMQMSVPDVTDGGAVSIDFEIAATSATDVNYGTLLDVLFTPQEDEAAEFQIAFGQATYSDISFSVAGEDVSGSIGSVVAENIGVKAFDSALIDFLDEAAAQAIAGQTMAPPSDPEIIEMVLGAYGAFSLGKFEIRDLDISGAEEFDVKVASLGIDDLSSAGLGSYYLTGVDVAGPVGEVVKVGEFSVSGVGFPEMAALIAFEQNQAAGNIVEMLKAIPTVENLRYSGVDITIPGENIDAGVELMELVMSGHIGPIPTELGLDIDALRVPVEELEPEQRMVFEAMGYEQVELSLGANLKWDEETQDVGIEFDSALVEGGSLNGSASIGGVPRAVFERPDQSAMFNLLGATFKELTLSYDDNSLVERGFAAAAQMNGTDADTMKAQVQGMLPLVLVSLGDLELATSLGEAVTNVIQNGDSFNLSAVAPTPLPLTMIGMSMQGNPAALLEQLEIEVSN